MPAPWLVQAFFKRFRKNSSEKNSSPQKTQGVLTLKTQHHGGFFSKKFKNSTLGRIFRQNVNKNYKYFTKS